MKLIILHGWGHDKTMWATFIQKLTRLVPEAKIEAWDLPGFGEEKLPSNNWGIPEYAEWVIGKLDSETEPVVILGHSLGGRIAAFVASQKPEWLSGTILVGAPLLRRPSFQVRLRIGFYKLVKRIIPTSWRKSFYAQELKEAEGDDLGKVFRKVVEFDQTEYLPLINVPVLLIWGENDNAAPTKIAYEADLLIPNSELIILPHLGHNLHFEAPDLLAGKIKRYLKP